MEPADRILEEISKDPLVDFATLFGSRAQGRPRPDSDWDVGVHFAASLGPRERFERRLRLVSALEPEVPVDIVVLNDAPSLVAHRALQGRPLLVRNREAWVRFFVRTLGLAGDERHYARIHAEARRRRLKEGTFGRP